MKVSRIIIMALVFVAVITMSLSVKAFTTVDLIGYLTSEQSVNGTKYVLSEDQKVAVRDYLTAHPVSDEVAESIKNDIETAKAKIAATGATKPSQVSQAVKNEVISLLKTAGNKAGVDVVVNLQAKTVTIVEQATGKNLASGSTKAFIYADSTNNSASQTSGTLVYTGAQSLVYIIPVLAVVAIASLIVIKKRS